MPSNDLEFDLPPNLNKSCRLGRYVQCLIRRIFDPDYVLPSYDIDLRLKAECQQIAEVVSEARRNIGKSDQCIQSL
jgi:hypothetical protein